jgi:hypothetical protein
MSGTQTPPLPDGFVLEKAEPPIPEGFVPEETPAHISAYEPSNWERLKSAIPSLGHVADILSGNKPAMAPMQPEDVTQLAYPERVYSATEQAEHPIRTGVDEFAGALTSPDNLLLMHGLGALGLAGGKLGQVLPRIASGAFSGLMGKGAYDAGSAAYQNWQQYKATGDERFKQEAMRLGTRSVLDAAMAFASAAHAANGERTASPGQTEETPSTGLRLRGTEPPIPAGFEPEEQTAPAGMPVPSSEAQQFGENAKPDVAQSAKDTLANLLSDETGSLNVSRVGDAIPNFFEQDVQPRVEAARQGLRESLAGIVALTAPRQEEGGLADRMLGLGVPEKALNSIMAMKGARDQALAEMDLRMADTRAAFDAMPEQERVAFIDNMKSGSPQASPELNDLADFYRKADDATYRNVIETQAADNPLWKSLTPEQKNTFVDGIKAGAIDPEAMPELKELADSLLTYKDNHFRVFWKELPVSKEAFDELVSQGVDAEEAIEQLRSGKRGFNGLGRAPLQGTKGFFKQSTLDSISDGIERGGVPVSTNPQRLFELSQADALKWITAQRMWQSLKQNGFAKFAQRGQPIPDGFVPLQDNIARVMFRAKSGEGMIEPGQWVVNSNAGRILNNYLSRDLIRETAAGKGLLAWKNLSTAAELSLSPFHWINMTFASIDTQISRGLRKLSTGDVAGGLKDIVTSPAAPYTTSRLGGSVLRYMKNADEFLKTTRGEDFIQQVPEAREAINDLFAAGGRIRMHEDYQTSMNEAFRDAIAKNNPIGAAVRAVPAFVETVNKPLFDSFIPRLKVGAFLKDYGQLIKENAADLANGKTSKPRLARQAWDRTENIFGELNWDSLFLNRTFKTLIQTGLRSATWQLGNLRQLASGFAGLSDLTKGKLNPDTAWAASVVMRTAIMGSLITRVLTGHWPTQLIDCFYPKTGGVDSRGKPNRMAMPGYFNTDYRLVTQPGQTARGALSSPMGRTSDVLANKDWRGQQIYDPTASTIAKAGAVAKYMTPVPFSVTNFQRAMESSGSTWQGVRGGLGFNNAPYDLDTTPAERLAREIVTQKIAQVRTPEQVANSQLRGKLAAEARNQDEAFKTDLRNAIHGGQLSQRQALQLAGSVQQSYLQGLVKHLGIEDTLRVWDLASSQERAELRPLLLDKATGKAFDDLPPSKQKALAGQIREALARPKGALTLK